MTIDDTALKRQKIIEESSVKPSVDTPDNWKPSKQGSGYGRKMPVDDYYEIKDIGK